MLMLPLRITTPRNSLPHTQRNHNRSLRRYATPFDPWISAVAADSNSSAPTNTATLPRPSIQYPPPSPTQLSSYLLSDPTLLWCGTAPSAQSTLASIISELRSLGGPDLTDDLSAILAKDPTASVNNGTIRSAVSALVRHRENAARGSESDTPALQFWARSEVEAKLYQGEIHRVYGTLLKDSGTLAREADAEAAAAASAAASTETAAPGRFIVPAGLANLLAAINKIFLFLMPMKLLSAIHGSIIGPAWVPNAKLWRSRDLEMYANILKHDASLQATFLQRLNRNSPEQVIKRTESGEYATSEACEVEYLKALVQTKAINHFAGHGPAPSNITHNNLPRLLNEMGARLNTVSGRTAATASGLASGIPVGSAETSPLHVRLETLPTVKVNPFVSVIRTMLTALVITLGLVCLWVLGAAQEIKLNGSDRAGALSNAGQAAGDKTSYAPKEFNKDLVPEMSLKKFSDVKGCDEAKDELQEVVEYLKNPERFIKMGAKLPKGVLLTGPPGTGKTLLAKAVAGEANVPFFYRAGSEFEEMFVGVGSRRVRALFAAAKKKAPCIIFIDEIDSIGTNRKQWENQSRKTLNQMLTEMDGFEENTGIIVVAATNLPEVLDPALTRPGRFDRRVSVNVPDVKGREEILAHYLSSKPLHDSVDAHDLARKTGGFSGAQLFNMVNEAALAAAKDNATSLTKAMLEEARDKVMMGKERTITRTDASVARTAYHEAGHAIVALFTRGADPLHKATINPRGDALGLTWQVPPTDEYSRSRTQLQASIDVCMGGTVAETLIYGIDDIGSGATSDLQQATKLARHMVCHCGFSDAIGPVYIDESSSSEARVQADQEVATMLKAARMRVHNMLNSRMHELRAVAEALINDETLDAQQISAICKRADAALPPPEAGNLDVETPDADSLLVVV